MVIEDGKEPTPLLNELELYPPVRIVLEAGGETLVPGACIKYDMLVTLEANGSFRRATCILMTCRVYWTR
jgi:hypothetical protein